MPILIEMIRWSAKYDPETAATKEFLERIENDSENLIAELRSGIKSTMNTK